MKSKSLILFLAIVLIISFFAYIAFFGLNIGKYEIVPAKDLIKLGLDLRGGVTVLLEAKDKPDDPINDEKMARAVATIRERIDTLGVTEPIITKVGADRIEVQLPEIQDPQRALDLIGQTAQLEFIEEETGKVILTGNDVKKAQAEFAPSKDGLGQAPVVAFELSPEGAKKFKEATERNINKIIGIYLDKNPISLPKVESVIPDGKGIITGSATMEEAGDLATLIRAGALPVPMETLSVTAVGPQLGANSFEQSVSAGQIGILLVFIFMIFYYRIPGLVADITLVLYLTLTLFALAAMKATLTLPGIAGLVLSVGMAVDANVVIYERIKDELHLGKTLRAAIESGFRRAFLTIFDSNLTTIIACVILFYFGSGPIRGFAVTLIVGVIISMFTAITITKIMLKLLTQGGILKSMRYFGERGVK
ncbi:MAG TPA: protein translocase subunit SecD [Bacillota bacterium]|nr:protein translocase subunit SecD [Bacillota bacterium]HQI16050.1 protein translocase subunit SecD [Bacillota bacterium]HQJ36983.1 protein translocase subunit SecD [Bacillota bacterium]